MSDFSYTDWASMSDKALIEAIGVFIRHQRLGQNKSQTQVADAAGISRSTLSLLERGENVALTSLIRVLRVLDLLQIMDVFSIREEISPIEYAKIQKNKRQRARSMDDDSSVREDDLGW